MKRLLRTEVARLGLEGHGGHAVDEVRSMYENVLYEGERLGVKMPHLRGFQAILIYLLWSINNAWLLVVQVAEAEKDTDTS